jgi:hypothetical protein
LIYHKRTQLDLISPKAEHSTLFFRTSGLGDSTPMYSSSVDALRKLVKLEGHIVNISPRDYKLSNGVEYCSVGVKGKNGIDYSIQAYGKEASELLKEVSMITETSILINPPNVTLDSK